MSHYSPYLEDTTKQLIDGVRTVAFHYLVGDHGSKVIIKYVKTYPHKYYPDMRDGTIEEYEVKVEFSTDKCVYPTILIDHMTEINQVICEHQKNVRENHQIVLSE